MWQVLSRRIPTVFRVPPICAAVVGPPKPQPKPQLQPQLQLVVTDVAAQGLPPVMRQRVQHSCHQKWHNPHHHTLNFQSSGQGMSGVKLRTWIYLQRLLFRAINPLQALISLPPQLQRIHHWTRHLPKPQHQLLVLLQTCRTISPYPTLN